MARLDRLYALTDRLRGSQHITLPELATEFGVSERTIARDLTFLHEHDVPIEGVPGRGGGLRLLRAEESRSASLDLGDHEVAALWLSVWLAASASAPTDGDAGRSAFEKIEAALPSDRRRRLRSLAERVLIGRAAGRHLLAGVTPPRPGVVSALARAFERSEGLAIAYTDAQGRPSTRTVEPHALLVTPPLWYLLSFDRDRDRGAPPPSASTASSRPRPRPAPPSPPSMYGRPSRSSSSPACDNRHSQRRTLEAMRRASIFAALPLLLALSACSSERETSSSPTSLDPVPVGHLAEAFNDLPDEYVFHVRNVEFVRGGTRHSIHGPDGSDPFDFDQPEHTVTESWTLVRVNADGETVGLTQDADGSPIVRTRTTGSLIAEEHVQSGRTGEFELSFTLPNIAVALGSAMLSEADRLRAGVDGGTFWTRSAEEPDRLLIGEPSDECGQNNESLPDTSLVQEVWADDFTPTGLSMCVAGPSNDEVLLERSLVSFEVLPVADWEAIRAFVFGTAP